MLITISSNKNHKPTGKAMFRKISLIIISFTFISFQVFATGGYLRHGYGVKYSALAGSGVSLSLGSMGAATNPAALAFMNSNQYEINLALFSPSRDYTITGNPSGYPGTFGLTPGNFESDSKYFPIPSIAATWKLNDNSALGAMLFANGGMNTNYPYRTFYDQTSPNTGVNLEQIFFGVTYAIKIAQDHSLGITGLYAYQRFSAQGLASFSMFSSDPSDLTGNRLSTSSGFGARFGYQGHISSQLYVGASYQTKMFMSNFDQYKGLFTEQGGFDIPANWTVGLAYLPTKEWTFSFDVQDIYYSGIKSVGNPLLPNLQTAQLGTDNGAGFGWKDIFVFKFGTMWKMSDNLTLMAGYSYGQEPIPDSQVLFNILAPATIQHHITAGFTTKLNETNEVSLALMYAPATSVSGPNPLEAPGQQSIKLNMSQWQLEVGYAFN
jgi:long-chain fatty acid transport protein